MSKEKGNEPLRVSVDEAKARTNAGNSVIVDVDDPDSFSQRDRKIPGARRIDPRDIAEEYEKLPESLAVFAYCTCPNEETSASVALFLRKRGYDAYAIRGGIDAWRDAEYPLEAKEG
jgi:rhodanese-related sulfurtransferase